MLYRWSGADSAYFCLHRDFLPDPRAIPKGFGKFWSDLAGAEPVWRAGGWRPRSGGAKPGGAKPAERMPNHGIICQIPKRICQIIPAPHSALPNGRESYKLGGCWLNWEIDRIGFSDAPIGLVISKSNKLPPCEDIFKGYQKMFGGFLSALNANL